MRTRILFSVFILVSAAGIAVALSAQEILDKTINRYRGDDSMISVTLTKAKLSNRSSVKKFNITTYRKVRPEVVKALVAVSKANDPDSKPILFLIWDWQAENKQDQIWYCLPSIGKYDKINSARGEEMSAKFGFSTDDMRTRNLDDATHTLEGEVTEGGEQCYKVVSVANNPKKEGFKQITSWIRMDSFTPVKLEILGLSGKIEKRLIVTRLEKVQGIWTEMAGVFEDHKKDAYITFEVKKVVYNPKLPNELFNFTQPPESLP